VGGVANVLTGPQAGKLSDRIGRKRIVILSSLGLAVVMTLTTLVIRDVGTAYALFFITMVLVAMRISPLSALLTALVSDDRRGSLMSLAVAIGQVGFAMGAALAGPLYTRFGYVSDTVLGAIAVLAMAAVVGYLVPEPDPEPVPAPVASAAD
jgi:predicted MFS family arabinose efflux permease